MKHILLVVGLFAIMCGGDFLHIGTRAAAGLHYTPASDIPGFGALIIGACCILVYSESKHA